jgi:hypothetical protein
MVALHSPWFNVDTKGYWYISQLGSRLDEMA